MIELKIKNFSVDLDEGTSITIEENNPSFGAEVLQGSFSIPFTIPASDRNRLFFGFPENLELLKLPKIRYDAELWVEGLPFKTGEIIFRTIGKNKYTINFQTESSTLTKSLNDIKLQELNHTDVTLVDFSQIGSGTWGLSAGHKVLRWTMASIGTLPNPFKIKINEKDFESAENSNTVRAQYVIDQVNAYTDETGVAASITFDGPAVTVTFRQLSPGLDPKCEVYLYDYTDWDPVYEWFWITEYEALFKPVINGLINNPDFVFPMIHNTALYPAVGEGEFSMNESGFINQYIENQFNLNDFEPSDFTQDLESPAKYSLCPMFYLRYVLDKIEEKAGIKFVGSWINDPDIQKLIIYNNRTIDHFEKVYNKDYNYYHNVISPGDFLPAISVNEFLLGIIDFFKLTFDYNPEENTFEFIAQKKILLDNDCIDITSRTNPDYNFDFKEPEGITYNYKFESKDELYNQKVKNKQSLDPLAPYVLDGGKTKKETIFSTLFSTTISGFKVPETLHPGGRDTSDFSPRLLFYYGLQPGALFDYLFASWDDTNFEGTVLNKYTLSWTGAKGLFSISHNVPGNFEENTQLVKWEAYLNINDLKAFRFYKKLRINGVRYIVKKITYTVTLSKGLLPVKLELYKADV